MKKILLFCLSLLVVSAAGWTEDLVLDNQTVYPSAHQKSRMAIQWASSAKEVEEGNQALIVGSKLNPTTLQMLTQSGKIALNIPEKADYFRVVVWSKGESDPDFLTNWVDVVPNKTYTLKNDYLIHSVLMFGTGC